MQKQTHVVARGTYSIADEFLILKSVRSPGMIWAMQGIDLRHFNGDVFFDNHPHPFKATKLKNIEKLNNYHQL